MPAITQDVILQHRLQKSGDSTPITLTAGDQVSIVKEWAGHFLIRTPDGKVFNILKKFVDPGQ